MFISGNLTQLYTDGSFSLWGYTTTETRNAVKATNYFPISSGILKNDIVRVTASDGFVESSMNYTTVGGSNELQWVEVPQR